MSFSANTKVVLASGAAIAISQLKVGDKVLATNVKTGKTQAEPVAAVLLHHDTNLYDLTVKTAQGIAVIGTTGSHLFWSPSSHRWVKAASFRHGSYLQTLRGTRLGVVGGFTPSSTAGWMWDLTVASDHDFYVDTVVGAVLAHNCGPSLDDLSGSGRDPDPNDAGGNLSRAGRAFAKHANLFPSVSGGPAALNEAGQNALDEILTNPSAVQQSVTAGNFVGGMRFITPDGIGAVFDSNNTFQYFGRFAYPW
ncbi:MAG: Hint domain-containing protein [Streptosporangiaceae bacterium]